MGSVSEEERLGRGERRHLWVEGDSKGSEGPNVSPGPVKPCPKYEWSDETHTRIAVPWWFLYRCLCWLCVEREKSALWRGLTTSYCPALVPWGKRGDESSRKTIIYQWEWCTWKGSVSNSTMRHQEKVVKVNIHK